MNILSEAWRAWRTRPLANGAAAMVLATGLAALATMASLGDLLLGGVPKQIPNKALYSVATGYGNSGSVTPLSVEEAREVQNALADQAPILFGWAEASLADGSHAERYSALRVSGDLFATLGWRMAMGPGFAADSFAADAVPTAVITDQLWQRRYAGAPDIVGRRVRIDGIDTEIVGVLPPRRAYPFQQQLYLASALSSAEAGTRWGLLASAPDEASQTRLASVITGLQQERVRLRGLSAEQSPIRLAPTFSEIGDSGSQTLLGVAMAVAVLLLAMAASNAGGLLLMQWLGRRREIATRSALGASFRQQLPPLLGQVLLVLGGALLLGLGLAQLALDALERYLTSSANGIPAYAELDFNPRVWLALLAGCALGGTLLLLPTFWRLKRGELRDDMQSGARGGQRWLNRFGRGALAFQLALGLIATSVAIACALAAQRSQASPSGIDGSAVLTAEFSSADADRLALFRAQLLQRLAQDPEVLSASVGHLLPHGMDAYRRELEGVPGFAEADFAPVDENFAAVYGIELRSGRWLSAEDVSAERAVAVITPQLATALGGDVLGRSLRLRQGDTLREVEVIGVSDALRLSGSASSHRPALFMPASKGFDSNYLLHVRTRGAPGAFEAALREHVRALDPDMALANVQSFEQAVWRVSEWTRFIAALFAPLGAIALLLAATALSALLATLIATQVREIGVRRALGATAPRLIRELGSHLAGWGVAGLGAGALLGALLAGTLAEALYSDASLVAPALAWSATVLLLSLLLAAVAPLRRALAIAPAHALRRE